MNETSTQAVYRILDASFNRSTEGLRTLEDWCRFGVDDAELTGQLKLLRHRLGEVLGQLSRTDLLAARDTPGDVGTSIQSSSEYHRHDTSDVVAAATARTAQALRVIEEYLKTIHPELAPTIEQARYDFYHLSATLERKYVNQRRQLRIEHAKLYALLDAGPDQASFETRVEQLAKAGVDIFQLRDKTQTDRVLIERAAGGTAVANRAGAQMILNDRADLALAAGCDGVHLGQDELPIEIARQIVGHEKLIGISTHSTEQAQQAVQAGADYIGCGPVFPGQTKTFDHYPGLDLVKQISGQISLPVFAIGGINRSNVQQVLDAGAQRIAVSGAIANSPSEAAEELKQLLDQRNSSGR